MKTVAQHLDGYAIQGVHITDAPMFKNFLESVQDDVTETVLKIIKSYGDHIDDSTMAHLLLSIFALKQRA